ncbi:MgtE-like protein [Halospina denitrificans]|uniref:MgtE-like protein n=1 Tax=Halospina denitrificans TaxID=332522 RepID=A0A4R7JTH7_9GAMM|nr:hypothetical protein [Halospina denitrificans]TDT41590.1 MgtE-like protein [Halospina denitrificans]
MGAVHPLKLAYAREQPSGLAHYLATQGQEAVSDALDGLPPETAVAVVARLPQGHLLRTLAGESDDQLALWLDAATPDHALSLLLHLEEARRPRILGRISSRRKRRTLERLLVYPRSTVGALVDPTATRLNADIQLEEAVAILRSDDHRGKEVVWLVGEDDAYLGLLDLRSALVASSGQVPLRRLLTQTRALQADTTLRDARDFPEWLRHPRLAVTDHGGRFLGELTRQRLMAALQGTQPANHGVAEGVNDLARQYFRILGICLDDLFGLQGRKR